MGAGGTGRGDAPRAEGRWWELLGLEGWSRSTDAGDQELVQGRWRGRSSLGAEGAGAQGQCRGAGEQEQGTLAIRKSSRGVGRGELWRPEGGLEQAGGQWRGWIPGSPERIAS